MKRSKEDTEKTKQSILAAAEKLFGEFGYTHTTLEQIAAEAGHTRGAIHWHFTNKNGLLFALREREQTPIQELTEYLKAGGGIDPLEGLQEVISNLFLRMEKEPGRREIMRLLFELEAIEMQSLTKSGKQDFRHEARGLVLDVFNIAYERGVLNPLWSPEYAALALFALVGGLIREWVEDEKADCSMIQDATAVVKIFMQSLAGGKHMISDVM